MKTSEWNGDSCMEWNEKQWNIELGQWNGMETVVWNGDCGMECRQWHEMWYGMETVA